MRVFMVASLFVTVLALASRRSCRRSRSVLIICQPTGREKFDQREIIQNEHFVSRRPTGRGRILRSTKTALWQYCAPQDQVAQVGGDEC
jgi:hypothetical protein